MSDIEDLIIETRRNLHDGSYIDPHPLLDAIERLFATSEHAGHRTAHEHDCFTARCFALAHDLERARMGDRLSDDERRLVG